jgi:hypothetical protein
MQLDRECQDMRQQWGARLNRYYATADILDAIVDGKFFSFDFAALVRAAQE